MYVHDPVYAPSVFQSFLREGEVLCLRCPVFGIFAVAVHGGQAVYIPAAEADRAVSKSYEFAENAYCCGTEKRFTLYIYEKILPQIGVKSRKRQGI